MTPIAPARLDVIIGLNTGQCFEKSGMPWFSGKKHLIVFTNKTAPGVTQTAADVTLAVLMFVFVQIFVRSFVQIFVRSFLHVFVHKWLYVPHPFAVNWWATCKTSVLLIRLECGITHFVN